ncbi:anti-sigma factor antagonist [Actinoplanes sp. NBRC 14428]|uniref:Anti-sigma factor antagonist n=1 Tax=Pseudosporangium ferrugineum TaxID=439699 RepID=A0A2T0REZ8_9ACTN|nr:STAS domain-containing protein [Pseudosporangium ferrugineum]PRY19735.1 anti-sigma B factor antagonist [Pseudosporangium ferrugineum]BCJ51951.1 anti-sigma factor antagonist [Actinoplanes sp. NBRC 14428]
MDLLVAARPGRGCTVVEVRGDLDMATSPQLREGVERLIGAGDRRVVVDLTSVGFMDSSALGALVTAFKAVRDAGGRLCVAGPQQPVRSVFAITSVDRVVEVYDTVAAAEAGLAGE